MTRRGRTIEPAYFDAMFRADPDPWGFRASTYEQDKYRTTLSVLRRDLYPEVLEVGCANGVFTRMMAARSGGLLAIDASAVALDLARATCADLPNVRLLHAAVPRGFPAGRFDLIIVSEVLYYLTAGDIEATAWHCATSLSADGDIILCHWLGDTDYPMTGHDAADLFVRTLVSMGFGHACLREEIYRLDRLSPQSKIA